MVIGCCAAALPMMGCAINGGLPGHVSTASLPAGSGQARGAVSDGSRAAVSGAAGQDVVAGSEAGAPGVTGIAGKPAVAKVALLLPLSASGELGGVAKALKQAGELALFDGGGQALQLIVKDDGGTPEGAVQAAEAAIRDGAELVLGPLTANAAQAVGPVVRRASVPVIAFSNDRRVAGAGVHVFGFMPEHEVERIVSFAAARGRRQFAALLPDDGYGRLAEAAFAGAVRQSGGNVAAIETYTGTGAGLLEALQRLVDALDRGAQSDAAAGAGGASDDAALFVPGGQELLTRLGAMAAHAKLDVRRIKLLGDSGWESPHIGSSRVLVGGWYPAPDPRGWQAFAEKYARTFGTVPPRIASLAFDAVGIAVVLARLPAGSRYSSANLTRATGFGGVDGLVRLMPDGTARRVLAVSEVQSFGTNIIDGPQVDGGNRLATASSVLPQRIPGEAAGVTAEIR